jgi:hypothetical protein
VADLTDTASRIALAHDGLTTKLTELRRREARVRTALSPIRHLANPWLRIGVAALIGYRFGRPGPAREAAPACAETLLGAIVRASLVVVAQAAVRRVLVELIADGAEAPSAGTPAFHGARPA